MIHWVVYLIKNNVNGKGYVGIANERYKTYQKRFEDHIALAEAGGRFAPNGRRYPLHSAILKYDSENFSIELLDNEYFSLEEAKEREEYWIEELDTNASGWSRNGYNLTWGGEELDWGSDDI